MFMIVSPSRKSSMNDMASIHQGALSNTNLLDTTSFSFNVYSDVTAPTLATFTPSAADFANQYMTTEAIFLTFNEKVSAGAAYITRQDYIGTAAPNYVRIPHGSYATTNIVQQPHKHVNVALEFDAPIQSGATGSIGVFEFKEGAPRVAICFGSSSPFVASRAGPRRHPGSHCQTFTRCDVSLAPGTAEGL